MRFVLLLLGAILVPIAPLRAQQAPGAAAPLRLFLDCSGFYCDLDYYRTEIGFVVYVRDRQDADVHLLITPQTTGSGGTEYTLNFIGQERFEDKRYPLRHVTPQTATEAERRAGLAHTVKLGLAPFVAATPAAARLAVEYTGHEGDEAVEPRVDPWDYWTFRTRVNGFFNGESQFSSESVFGSFSAQRVTEAWKIRMGLNGNRSEREFEINDSTTFTSLERSYSTNGLIVKSLSSHWSAGVTASASSSTFLNQDLALRVAPAVEYSVFPYDVATRKQLFVRYSLGISSFDYTERTIFDQTAEVLPDHSLVIGTDMKQPWGSIDLSLETFQYLHDLERYRANLSGDLDIRLLKGLLLNLFGSVGSLRDQIYLSAAGATEEDILLRLRALETSYRYFFSVGLSYTFGSIYNDVVNPRFPDGGGGFVIR